MVSPLMGREGRRWLAKSPTQSESEERKRRERQIYLSFSSGDVMNVKG